MNTNKAIFWTLTVLEAGAFLLCFRHFGAIILALILHGLADRVLEKKNLPTR